MMQILSFTTLIWPFSVTSSETGVKMYPASSNHNFDTMSWLMHQKKKGLIAPDPVLYYRSLRFKHVCRFHCNRSAMFLLCYCDMFDIFVCRYWTSNTFLFLR